MRTDLTTGELLQEGIRRLQPTLQSPQLDAELLLAHALHLQRTRLKSHPEETRDRDECERYLALIERRARGEPFAYLTGEREFWSLRLTVDASVLVPRPESELLVERALALRDGRPARAADLGTGSGAIALALARERPSWQIIATDVSEDALRTARRNAEVLAITSVEFRLGSWFTPLAGCRFDVLLSNPPYIALNDPVLQFAPLAFEPQVALTPGPDALSSLTAIIRDAPAHLEREGWLLLEHGAAQAAAVARALVARGFAHVRSHRDLAGHERMTEARWH
jgi:release factor glutamine methyltransferase